MDKLDESPLMILNLNTLRDRTLNDQELMTEILKIFLEDAPCQIQIIKDSFSENSFEQMQDAAHSLKGSAANIGAERLQNTAKAIEYAVKEKKYSQLQTLITLLENQFLELKSEINKLLQNFT